MATATDLNVCPEEVGTISEVEGGVRWRQDQDRNLIFLTPSKEEHSFFVFVFCFGFFQAFTLPPL